jgi:hypothetical protein
MQRRDTLKLLAANAGYGQSCLLITILAAVPVMREYSLDLARYPARPRGAARPHET